MSAKARAGIRLVAGSLRGRSLSVPSGVRPTEGRVREALFSIWGGAVVDAVFLDLFAGSGAVGIEALSRGARQAILVEGDRGTMRALVAGVARLPTGGATVLELELPRGLADHRVRAEGPFDLVFADPPYRFAAYEPLLAGIGPILASSGEAVIEHSAEVELPPEIALAGASLVRREVRRYGGTRLSFFRRS
jgi:16S rRNA (guanine(966)-N(2))-methyltransferase RsmD